MIENILTLKVRVALNLIGILLGFIWVSDASAMGDYSKMNIPQIKYRGGHFKPRPEALESLLVQVANRTAVEVKRSPLEMELDNPELYRYPFIYMSGNDSFETFNPEQLNALRNYLSYGGFLLIDDSSSVASSKFDASARKMIAQLFPQTLLRKLPDDHSIYRSFYLINRPAGRLIVNPYLEGVTIKGRTVLVYSSNDLGGAWSRDKLGHWNHEIIGDPEMQRKTSIRLGVNIVIYSLTLDYKKDMVHLPIILERLRRYYSE